MIRRFHAWKFHFPKTKYERAAFGILLLFNGIVMLILGMAVDRGRANAKTIDDILSVADMHKSAVIGGEITKDNLIGMFDTGNLLAQKEYYCFVKTENQVIITVNIPNQEQIDTIKSIQDGSDKTLPLETIVSEMGSKQKDMARIVLVNRIGCSEEEAETAMSGYILKNSNEKPKNTLNRFKFIAFSSFVCCVLVFLPDIINLISRIRTR